MDDDERGDETRHCSDGVLSNNTTALHPACRVAKCKKDYTEQIIKTNCNKFNKTDSVLSNKTTALHPACVFNDIYVYMRMCISVVQQ